MERIEIHSAPRELWALIVIALILLVGMGGLPFWVSPKPHPDDPQWLAGTIIWTVAVAFILLAGVIISSCLRQLRSGEVPVVIDKEGLADRRLGAGVIAWSQIDEVRKVTTEGGSQVLIKLKDGEDMMRQTSFSRRLGWRLTRLFNSADISISAVGLNISAAKLYALIHAQLSDRPEEAV